MGNMDKGSWRDRVIGVIDAAGEDLVDLAKFIHAHPEVGMEERQAAARCVALLKKHGFEVQQGVAGLRTAFVGRKGRERPAVGILVEYDALPGVGHGCGHNLLAGSTIGAAIGAAAVVDETGGTVYAFGTPAEEDKGGKVHMVRAGLFAGVDAVLGTHPHPAHATIPLLPGSGNSLACRSVKIEFFGKSAHAAMDPHNGINALNAVIETFNGINALRQHIKPSARIHGVIRDGGKAMNVVPDYASAEFLVRAENRHERDELMKKVQAIAKGAALITGARLKLRLSSTPYDDMINNFTITRRMKAHLDAVGLPTESEPPGPGQASSDIGNVSYLVPTGSSFYPICDDIIPWHSPTAAAASDTEQAYQSMLKAAKAVALTALDLLSDADLLQAAKREHGAALEERSASLA